MTTLNKYIIFDGRHHKNSFQDYDESTNYEEIDPDSKNDISEVFKKHLKEKLKDLIEELEKNQSDWYDRDDGSIYTGIGGIAQMYYLCGKVLNDSTYTNKALELIEKSLDKCDKKKKRISYLAGRPGPLALGAILYSSSGNDRRSLEFISMLRAFADKVLNERSNELLYGKIGYLYALLLVNSNIPSRPVKDEEIHQIVDRILMDGKEYASFCGCKLPLMYHWSDKAYIGGAHGLAGILYVLLQAKEYLTEEQLQQEIKPMLDYLETKQFPSGNFPSSIANDRDRLVHWCHGAPSLSMLFALAYKMFGKESYLQTAVECAEAVWSRGLLKKGYSLCHGVSGNAYTFICLYQLTKDVKYLYRACKFAQWCTSYDKPCQRPPNRPYSLFEGTCIIAVLVASNIVLGFLIIYNNSSIEFGPENQAIFEDFGNSVLMAGVVDSHVHVNDPGRTEWEEFRTATRAAAAGGITTIVDMPLNSIPATTSVVNFMEKIGVAKKNAFVDVAFWGGLVPGNKADLKPLIEAGVVGFKCFLLPSGIDEFRHVTFDEVEEALEELKSTGSVLAFHAECELEEESTKTKAKVDPGLYQNFLDSRPQAMEVTAIEKIALACNKSGVRCHIVHLSAGEALGIVEEAKKNGTPLTAETCHHYLSLAAEDVPYGATEYKCCPPIRNRDNMEKLWLGLKADTLGMIVSDHSPCTENLKIPDDFMAAWGGISSLQFGLSLAWTSGRRRGLDLPTISRLLSANPAELCGLQKRKGKIAVGADADFVVWRPDEKFTIRKADILHKNKLTPYEGKVLFGRVDATFLRGRCVYENGKVSESMTGELLLRNN